MSALYLIRFDDLCPTMHWKNWHRVEELLCEYSIRPLLAVVPDNRDRALVVHDPVPDFWDRVRGWQSRGWSIAVHGYQHLYTEANGGLLGISNKSEFAGLSRATQKQKLEAAVRIFAKESIHTKIFIAPSHSYDQTTLETLLEVGLSVVSDSFALYPYSDARGILFLPQQLWAFRWMPIGLYTVCLHPNSWSEPEFRQFKANLKRFASRVLDPAAMAARFKQRQFDFRDAAFDRAWRTLRKIRLLEAEGNAARS